MVIDEEETTKRWERDYVVARDSKSNGDHGWQKEQADPEPENVPNKLVARVTAGPGYILDSPFCESRRRIRAPFKPGRRDRGRRPTREKKKRNHANTPSRRHIAVNF